MTHREYLKFFNAITALIALLVKIHQACEELYISGQFEFDDELNGDD